MYDGFPFTCVDAALIVHVCLLQKFRHQISMEKHSVPVYCTLYVHLFRIKPKPNFESGCMHPSSSLSFCWANFVCHTVGRDFAKLQTEGRRRYWKWNWCVRVYPPKKEGERRMLRDRHVLPLRTCCFLHFSTLKPELKINF